MYISDEVAIINTMGLRWVTKMDRSFSANTHYYLEIQYKGANRQIEYKSEAARDNMFNRISEALATDKNKTIVA